MTDQSIRDRCAIVGVGESPYARKGARPFKELQIGAISKAIADAGLQPSDIDGIITDQHVTANVMPIEEVFTALKMTNVRFIGYSTRGGAGVNLSTLIAAQALLTGTCKYVLFYLGTDWGSSTGAAYASHKDFHVKQPFEVPYGFYGQPIFFAAMTRRYQQQFGYTEDDMVNGLGALAVTCRKHAQLHPGAQTYGQPMTLDDYRNSRIIATPFRAADCCLLTDGGGAYIMTTAERAKDCPHPPVFLTAVGTGNIPLSIDAALTQAPDYLGVGAARIAAKHALEMANITLKDVDFAEFYDCFTISLLTQFESVGFCKSGEGVQFVQNGRVEIGGEIPINTHGGLLAHAYVHTINHMVEAVVQLRHDAGARQVKDAKFGLLSADPGVFHCVVILRS